MKTTTRVSRASRFAFAALIALQLSAQAALAGVGSKYEGDFKVTPAAGHSGATISGVVTLLSADGIVFSEAIVTPSAPVYGKKEFRSDLIETFYLKAASSDHLGIIVKLKGAPHKWHFVAVLSSVDGGVTYQGSYYKVTEKLADIQAALTAATGVPGATWKLLGDLVLKKQ